VKGKESPFFIDPSKCPKFAPRKGVETTVLTGLHGEKMMMALTATLPNNEVPTHSHPNEQIGMVFSGKALLRIGDEERVVGKGDFYRIPSNVPHSDVTIGNEPFIMLDIFCPVREDFIKNVKERK